MLERNHPCVSAKAVTIEKNSMSRQKSLLCIDTIWSCKVAAKILLFIETKILPRDWKARFTFQIQFLLLARPGKTQGWHYMAKPNCFSHYGGQDQRFHMFRFVIKKLLWEKLIWKDSLYSIVQQQCLLAAQLHYLQAYLTASQHQQQQQFAAVGSLSQHVERGGKEFPSDGRVVLPPGGENQESPRSNVNAVSVVTI